MKRTRLVYVLGLCAALAALTAAAEAQIIHAENAGTWGIGNELLAIPSGSLITGAELVLYDVRRLRGDAALSVQLLDNPTPDIAEFEDGQPGNFFAGHGTPLAAFSGAALTAEAQTITVDLAQIDRPECWTRQRFETAPVVTLADSSTIRCGSALLALFDYAGTGTSFGFGLDCDGVSIKAVRLNLTIQSTTALAAAKTLTFTAGRLNTAPVLSPLADPSIMEGQTLRFSVEATDADNDSLHYAASNLPAGAAFANQIFTWTPSYDQAGTYSVDLTVSDGIETVGQTVTITVADTNRAPVLAALGSQTVAEGQTLGFQVSASDPDGDAVTLGGSGLPAGATLVNGRFNWTPGYDQSGTYTLTVTASDGLLTARQTVTITVTDTNRAPVLAAVADQAVTAGETIRFTVAGSDPDGDSLSLSAHPLPAGAVFDKGLFTWSPTNEQAGSYTVTFTGSDGRGGTDTLTVRMTVTAKAAEWVQLAYDDFEAGLGNYTLGGWDAKLYTGGRYAHQGSNAVNIQDDSGVRSSFFLTHGLDLTGYTELSIEFWYMPVSMDNYREHFRLEYWDGSRWIVLGQWAKDLDFQNNQFYFETVTVTGTDIAFVANANIRFICDASSNYDDVYIDEIRISAK